MALTEKYRPHAFSEVVGQKGVDLIRSYVGKKDIPGLWVLFGQKGTGKTSTARIFALALNCEHPDREHNPCLTCVNCKEILNGVSDLLLELDAASNRGIDDIRALQKVVALRSRGIKVIVLDEAHQLTEAAWNSLLKLAESPPKNVVLVLVTTQVEKIISTIRDRAVQVKFERVSDALLSRHLVSLAKLEGVENKLGSDAMDAIIKKADGSMRSLVKGLDVFISLALEGREVDFTKMYSGTDEEEKVQVELTKAFLGKRISHFGEVVEKMKQLGVQPHEVLLRLYSECMTVVLRGKGMRTVRGSEEYAGVEMTKEQLMWLSNKLPSWMSMMREYPDYNLLVKLCLEFVVFF